MRVELSNYHEDKPHYLKRIVWVLVNATLFGLLGKRGRNVLLRLFGAKVGNCLVYRTVRVFAPWNLEIGDWSCIGPHVEVYNKARVVVGGNSVISQDSYLCTASHDIASRQMRLSISPIFVGDNVWLAAKSVVLSGVTIGEGAVVGCAAVVTKDVEPWTVVGGNPATFIKKRELKND